MGLYFKVRSAKTIPKATWSARKGKAIVLVVSCMGHKQQRRARLCSVSETRSCSRRAYEGEVEQWAVEKELAEMTGLLEQLAGLEEKEGESGSWVHGSENCLREY